jgi:hypothetical protein
MKKFIFASLARVKPSKVAIVGAVLAASMSLTGTVRADSVTGSVWAGATVFPNSLSTNWSSLGTPTATFTVSNPTGNIFNFFSSTDSDLTSFLTNNGTNGNTVAYLTGGDQTGSSSNRLATYGINNDVMLFTGTTYLVNGMTYSITKDDAAYLTINGVTEISALSDTSAESYSFVWLGATGTYNFDLLYQEVNGPNAVLTSDITATPEPSSLLLLGSGLLGLAFVVFRKNKPAGLVLHT